MLNDTCHLTDLDQQHADTVDGVLQRYQDEGTFSGMLFIPNFSSSSHLISTRGLSDVKTQLDHLPYLLKCMMGVFLKFVR